tara:strand:+ start:4571 stop:6769 length:2199 start_codon:yes stop_codon:yes gene_type:complete
MATRTRTRNNEVHAIELPELTYGSNKKIVDFVDVKMEQIRSTRDRLERQWYLNIAYYLGHQYLQWDSHSKRLYLPHAPKHRQRVVINRLMPIVRRIISSTIRNNPQWVVSPATTETEDMITAQLGTSYLKYQWRNLDMDNKLIDLIKWRSTTGNVFVRAFWNAHAGERMVVDTAELAGEIPRDPGDKKRLRKEAMKKLKKEGLVAPEDDLDRIAIHMGDVDFEVVSPFHIFPDPGADTLDSAEWLIDQRQRTLQYVKDHYNYKPAPSSEDEVTSSYENKLKSMDAPAFSGALAGVYSRESEDMVNVKTIYVKPTKKEPDGWWATIVDDKVVRKNKNQPGFPTFPYFHIQEIPVPGRIWGSCVLEQAIPAQVAYNRARSQVIEHCNTVTRPPWLIPKGSGISDNAFTGEPGEKITFTWPMEPKLADPAPLPNANDKNLTGLIRDIEDIASQHEAQRGEAPGRVESGVGLSALMEQDDSILAPASMQTASAMASAGSCLLKIASVMVDEERIIKIVGEEHLIDVRHFKGQDLIGRNSSKAGVNYFDVKVEMGTSVPLSATARRELAMSLAQFGILDPSKKADKEKILELLELQRDPATATPGQLDKGNARYENAQLANGELIDPKDFDDHDLHIATHREFQKSAEYRRLLEDTGGVDGQANQLFEQHIQAHIDRLEQLVESVPGMGPPEMMPPPGMGTPPLPPTMAGPGGPPTGGGIPPEILMQQMQQPPPPPI